MGFVATAFVKGLHCVEGLFDRIRNPYLRHASGMLLVGLMIYALFRAFGHYYVEGVGYSTVQNVLLGRLASGSLLGLLFVCKLTATCLSLGSGSSGGIFSPSLFMGATLGAAFWHACQWGNPVAEPQHSRFAIVGMAAMVGGATGAAMTAVTMIFEMTRDYDIVMLMIVAVALSIGIRRVLSQENYLHD
jgi:chloride channel protein, CIC family